MSGNADEMTIDELARAAGIVVSTVRLYQNRGLLTPPVKRGRVGYYNAGHLQRLRLIAQLQERGFSLAGIKELLVGVDNGESLTAVLGLAGAPSTWTPEQPEVMTLTELVERLPGVEFTGEMVARVVELGLVEMADDGARVVVLSPSFLRIGSELAALGVPGEVILDQYELLRSDADRIAGRFTEVFRAHMWEPFVEGGAPPERIGDVVNSLGELGPLAEAVVTTSLRQSLQRLAEELIRTEAQRLGIEIPRPGAMG